MIITGDVLTWAAQYDGPPFHSLLCDPPYELAFMNKGWDNTGIAFRPETWAALAEHLHPGAFGMAFASSRGWHRMACAIEDAGLVFHPSVFLLGWCFGSGFPKSTRIRNNGQDAPDWETHRYGMQSLKPALEPVIVFQRPYAGRPVDSITRTGAGAINVDGGRIPTDPGGADDARLGGNGEWHISRAQSEHTVSLPPAEMGSSPLGRWPAHLALVHTPDCTPDACADGCAVRALGEQSGESVSNAAPRGGTSPNPMSWYEGRTDGDVVAGVSDTGTAARFFFNADYLPERMAGEPPFRYTAKADRWEREAGLSGPTQDAIGRDMYSGLPDLRMDHLQNRTARRNAHPTVKPLAMLHWLATLLLPPDAYAPRRLLVPFAGSGSEVIGATLAGWEDVVGIEQDAGYVAIAEQRLAFWQRFVGADGWEATQQRARAWADAEEARAVMEAGGQLTLPMFDDAAR